MPPIIVKLIVSIILGAYVACAVETASKWERGMMFFFSGLGTFLMTLGLTPH